MKRFIIAVALAACSISVNAGEGLRLEILGGQCQTQVIGPGIWYQVEYPHELGLTSDCFQVSVSEVTKRIGGIGYGWRFGYADFGTTRMFSGHAVLDHEQHLVPSGEHCDPKTFSGCAAWTNTKQRIQGFSYGWLAEVRAKGWEIGAEAGVFAYSGSFDIDMHVHDMGQPVNWVLHFQGEYLSPYFGMTLRRGNLFMLARVYTAIRAGEHNCGGCSGFSKDAVTTIKVGASF